MAQSDDKIDLTAAIFVVHDEKVLIIHQRKLDKRPPPGSHLEAEEDPERTALRDEKDESELDAPSPPVTGAVNRHRRRVPTDIFDRS